MKKLNSISRERLNFRRRPILCTTLYRNPMQASNFGGTFDQLFLWIFFIKFSQKMPLYLFSTMVQKSRKWPKTQIKGGGPALIPKTIGNRKRNCAWGCARGINTTCENLQIESTNQSSERKARLPDLCFSICSFLRWFFSPIATSRTISFSISHSFWY